MVWKGRLTEGEAFELRSVYIRVRQQSCLYLRTFQKKGTARTKQKQDWLVQEADRRWANGGH